MTKITIDGREYEADAKLANHLEDTVKALGEPIEPEEEVEVYDLLFGTVGTGWVLEEEYDLTPPEAEAVAKAIEDFMDFLLSKTHDFYNGELGKSSKKAKELIQKRKASK